MLERHFQLTYASWIRVASARTQCTCHKTLYRRVRHFGQYQRREKRFRQHVENLVDFCNEPYIICWSLCWKSQWPAIAIGHPSPFDMVDANLAFFTKRTDLRTNGACKYNYVSKILFIWRNGPPPFSDPRGKGWQKWGFKCQPMLI